MCLHKFSKGKNKAKFNQNFLLKFDIYGILKFTKLFKLYGFNLFYIEKDYGIWYTLLFLSYI